jgi:Rrf2 family protein
MLFSKACEYAIRVVLNLAVSDKEGYTPVREIADRSGVPVHYLGKICGELAQTGVLVSYKGPHGGVALSKPPEDISLLDVVQAIDGNALFDRCVLGLDPCSHELPCPVHNLWAGARDQIHDMVARKTLKQLGDELQSGTTSLRQVLAADD